MTKKREQPAPQQPAESHIYLGPTLSRGRLNANAIYRSGEIPPYLVDLFSRYPEEFGLLFVPLSRMRFVMSSINTPGTPERIAYSTLKGV